MKTIHVLFATVLLSVPACAGRKAAWQNSDGGAKGAAGDVAAQIAEGDKHWANRTDPNEIRAAIAAWEKVANADPKNFDVLVKLTRANYFLADGYLRNDEKEYLRTMDLGVKWGEKAMIASSNRSPPIRTEAA